MFRNANLAELEPDELQGAQWPALSDGNKSKINVLLVEDVESDALLTQRALEKTQIPFSLSNIKYGTKILSLLNISQRVCPEECPDLILLDLGLPDMDGFEVLSEMSQMSAAIRSIPIVVLTSHKQFEYIRHSYPLYMMAYINKPCAVPEIKSVLEQVRRWKQHDGKWH